MSVVAAAGQRADAAPCATIGANQIQVDGMLGDWSSVRAHQVGRRAADASFKLRCAHDGSRLLLAFHIRDDHVIRFRNTQPARNDHLIVKLWTGNPRRAIQLQLFPGVDKIQPVRRWAGGRVPRDVRIEDTLQRDGWSAEVVIPFRRLQGLSKFSPGVRAEIVYRDFDIGRGKRRTEFRELLQFPGAAAQLRAFLAAAKLHHTDIRSDRLINVDSRPGPERVVIAGTIVGVITDQFTFLQLPVKTRRDLKSVKLIDLAGAGRHAIVAEYRQHGNGGSRDVVGVWYVGDNGNFDRTLAFEVRKQKGRNVIANKWKLTRPGQHRRARRRGGFDILHTAGKATGWDEDNYFVSPARDVNPILLPWSDDTATVYYFTGTRVGVSKKTR